jgi:hypothetical protein
MELPLDFKWLRKVGLARLQLTMPSLARRNVFYLKNPNFKVVKGHCPPSVAGFVRTTFLSCQIETSLQGLEQASAT